MRILIVHQGAIGDFILSLPAIGSFRYNFPGASIEIWGYPDILQLVEKRFYADTISSINRKEMAQCYNENALLDTKLVECFRQFGLIVIFGGEGQKTLLHNLKRIKMKEVHCINTFPQREEKAHIIDYQISQLSPLGFRVHDKVPTLFPNENDLKQATEFFTQRQLDNSSPMVAIHIGSGSRRKVWLPGFFAQLSEKLIEDYRAKIIVPIGPADEEIAHEYFNFVASDAIIPLVNLPINKLAAILQKCKLYIGNDSGITHLAAALGIPVVALFGPTDPHIWGPRGKGVSIVYKPSECSPCSREKMKRCVNQMCMEEISVEEVYSRVKCVIHDP
ncbi:MAG: hypothetical protein AMJ42_03785 [Deltaproteobacteria bacterium DG_8]|nr:MAG: hypothetical protein AMJ42_03785 [Deltaproteobacteria bacterium DG_8]